LATVISPVPLSPLQIALTRTMRMRQSVSCQ
jgi:hypothetical protein